MHIGAFVSALGHRFGGVELVTVPGPGEPDPSLGCRQGREWAPGVTHYALPAIGPNLISRVLHFREELRHWWRDRQPEILHFRSIFEGFPLTPPHHAARQARVVYEVNGLPSIELKYHYPAVERDREFLGKLVAQENACLLRADRILTVSEVTREHLRGRGVPDGKIICIPNGVDLDLWKPAPALDPDLPLSGEMRILYSGTFSAWQGIHVALEAAALALRDFPVRLVLVGAARERQIKDLRQRAADLGILDHLEILPPVDAQTLVALHRQSDVILAPLMANDRNLEQGCCPLKVLEAMASRRPLIASDLPVVSALARHREEALLVRPNSAKAIKDALLDLRREPDLASQLVRKARARVESRFSWGHAQDSLMQVYEELLSPDS